VSTDCLRARSALPVSHDHLFHTVLGVMDISTQVRQGALDLLAPCSAQNLVMAKPAD